MEPASASSALSEDRCVVNNEDGSRPVFLQSAESVCREEMDRMKRRMKMETPVTQGCDDSPNMVSRRTKQPTKLSKSTVRSGSL